MLQKFFYTFALILLFSITNAQERVRIHTTNGVIEVKLYSNTPIHRKNFIRLAEEGFYDSTEFHRIIPEFMIQAGDPNSKPKDGERPSRVGSGGPGYTLEAELGKGHIHKKGALAAARQPDNVNPKKRSSGSQFYIVVGRKIPTQYIGSFEEKNGLTYTEEQKQAYAKVGGTPHLDGGYTVFGEVTSGLELVEELSKVKTARGDRPVEPVYITKTEVIK